MEMIMASSKSSGLSFVQNWKTGLMVNMAEENLTFEQNYFPTFQPDNGCSIV